MALTEQQRNALAMGAQTAGYGAAIGAPIGGPVGAGIGAGIGFLGGTGASYFSDTGETDYELQRREQIADLKRRQEMGLLGLTEEERANLSAQLIDPIRAQQRQQQLQTLGAIGGMGGGPADVARFGLGAEQRIAEQMQPALTEIARADLAKAKMEEEQMLALLREQDGQIKQEEQMRQQQIMQGMSVAGKSLMAFSAAEGEAAAKAAEQKALLRILGGAQGISGEAATGADALFNSIYGSSVTGLSGGK